MIAAAEGKARKERRRAIEGRPISLAHRGPPAVRRVRVIEGGSR